MLRLLFFLFGLLPSGTRRFIVRLFMELVWRLYTQQRLYGHENIPAGPCLFICNHLSNADGYTLHRALRPKQVLFLAGVKLQSTVMTRIASESVDTIPIRPNSPDVEALKRAVEMLRAGHSVLIFPEGGRSRSGALIRAKQGASLIAKRAGVPIVPIGLTGTEKFLPINDRDMGGERIHRATLEVRIGKPFAMSELQMELGEAESRQALSDAMMRKVAALLPPAYRGVYGA